MAINYFDVAVILILLLFGVRGCIRGFVAEIAGLVGLIGGLWMARRFYTPVAEYLTFIPSSDWRYVAAYIIVFFAFLLVVGIVARLLRHILSLSFISWLDKIAGMLLGLVKGLLICSILLLFVKNFLPEAQFVRESFMYGYLNTIMAQIQAHLPDNFFDLFKA